MGKIQDCYDTRVRPMIPAERLQLARMILDDLTHLDNAVDISDEWGDDDLSELSALSAQQRDRASGDARSGDESR